MASTKIPRFFRVLEKLALHVMHVLEKQVIHVMHVLVRRGLEQRQQGWAVAWGEVKYLASKHEDLSLGP